MNRSDQPTTEAQGPEGAAERLARRPLAVDAGTAGSGEARLSLAELTRAAGVSIRTVRYYIAEGLLPPPVGAGPRSAYTDSHLDRLRLIARFKAAFLPLKEIRRRLSGLGDAEVRRLLAGEGAERTTEKVADDSAAAYLDRVLGARHAAPAVPVSSMVSDGSRLEVWGTLAPPSVPPSPPVEPAPPPILGRAYPASFGPLPEVAIEAESEVPEPADEAETWRRVRLGEDAELLIRESAYRRKRDRVEWLLAWARKVFG